MLLGLNCKAKALLAFGRSRDAWREDLSLVVQCCMTWRQLVEPRTPALRRWWNTIPLLYAAYSLHANRVAQLSQFALNRAVAPIAIFVGEAHNQSLKFILDPWSLPTLRLSLGSLMWHKLTLPVECRLRLNKPDQLTPLPDTAVLEGFQLDHDDRKRQLLRTRHPSRSRCLLCHDDQRLT